VPGQSAALPPLPWDDEGAAADGVDDDVELLEDSLLPLVEDSLAAAGVVEVSALRLSFR
jgi:hypothetical protein